MSKKKTTTKKATSTAKASDPDLVTLSEAMKKPGKGKARAAKPKAPKPAKQVTEKKLPCLGAAARVLKDAGGPLNCPAMIAAMAEKKLRTSTALTPHATLYSAILREITTKKSDSRFKKVDRGQ